MRTEGLEANKQKTLEMLGCTQPTITFSKLTIETLEQGVKYEQS